MDKIIFQYNYMGMYDFGYFSALTFSPGST